MPVPIRPASRRTGDLRPPLPRGRRLALERLEARMLLAWLPLTETIYFSTEVSGSLTGSDGVSVRFDDSDILRLAIERSETGQIVDYGYQILFDGSDVGLDSDGEDIDALAILADGRLVISTSGRATVPGASAEPQDLLVFTPAPGGLGIQTAGAWSVWFDGSDVGLSTSSENIDAVAMLGDGRLLLSTTGNVSVPGVNGRAEDVLVFRPGEQGFGPATGGAWGMQFDGSQQQLTASGEMIDALSVQDAVLLHLSTSGIFSVTAAAGNDEDIFTFDLSSGTYVAGPRIDGSAVGLADYDIDALHFGTPDPYADIRLQQVPTIDVSRVLNAAQAKLAAHDAAHSVKTRYASASPLNSRTWTTVGPSSWESGFYPGALWLMYEWTQDPAWLARARAWTAGIEGQKNNTSTHDLGFMVHNSFGQGARLTGDAAYKDVVLAAARSLSSRYSRAVGATRSWNGGGFRVIIDNMMNLELLFWAAKNGGTTAGGGSAQDLYNMAVSHARKTLQNHVRPDGSTFHVVNYDAGSGRVMSRSTAQGKSAGSTWSRGQAWAVYGFTMTFRETADPVFLEAARRTADYFLDNLPEDWVPQADFNSTYTDLAHKDSSASAIVASALVELSTLETDAARRDRYWAAATHLLDALSSAPYFSAGPDNAALLLHGSRKYPGNNSGYMFGDYYLIEAAVRYAKVSRGLPL